MAILQRRKYHYVQRKGQIGFKCLKCKLVSFHPKDIENRYCGNCHVFYEPQEPTRFEVWWHEQGHHATAVAAYTLVYAAILAFVNWHVTGNSYLLAVLVTFVNLVAFGMAREGDGRRIAHEQYLDFQRYMARQMKAITDKVEGGG